MSWLGAILMFIGIVILALIGTCAVVGVALWYLITAEEEEIARRGDYRNLRAS